MNNLEEETITEEQEIILKSVLANNISAMKISKILREHSQNDILTTDMVVSGLIYRLMTPMTDDELKKNIDEAESILYAESSEDEEEIETVDEPIGEKRNIKYNSCNCDICMQTRICLLNFKDFIPKDPLGDIVKNSIYETCEKYNLLL
tara:strand:+ start:660 stop:1106 length:447 start_codon:yes stop_codon:yes gene_type:complete